MISYGESLESVILSLEFLEIVGVEGAKNREKKLEFHSLNVEKSLKLQHPL